MDDGGEFDDEDDYDDEEMDEDDNPRLSPLHNKKQEFPPLPMPSEGLKQDDEDNNEEEEDDYYDELIKRGQKLHTNVVKKQASRDKDFDDEFPLATNEDQSHQSSV